jgi:uncharacterized protein YukE
MSKIGADIGQLQALKQTFAKEAEDVGRLMSALDRQVTDAWWVGPAADRFKSDWNGVFKPNLQKLQQALTDAGTEVENRRRAIETAGS